MIIEPDTIQFGSLFEFIPSITTTQTSLRTSQMIKSRSRSIDYHHPSRSDSINRLSEIVKAKNRRIEEQKERQDKQLWYRNRQKSRTSEVSKRFTRTNGFFSDNPEKKQLLAYDKQTEKQRRCQIRIDKKHGLLRAIVKTKYEDSKYNQPDFYNESFNRLQKGFKEIKLKEVLSTKDEFIQPRQFEAAQGIINLMKTNIPIKYIPEASSLSARTRIRMENCKSWAQKHKRKSQFYDRKLNSSLPGSQYGKDTSKERNRIMNSIRSFVR